MSTQDSFLFLASEFHFGHFFFSRINAILFFKNFLVYSWLLGCWLLLLYNGRKGLGPPSNAERPPLTSASYPMFSPPLRFSSSLPHNSRNKAFATTVDLLARSKKHLCRRVSRGIFCFCIEEMIARAMWTNSSIGSTVDPRKDVSQTRQFIAAFIPCFNIPSEPFGVSAHWEVVPRITPSLHNTVTSYAR